MGAPKVSTIGGGGAKPVADGFNTFLLNQLNSGTLGGMMNGQNNPSPLSFNTQNVDMNNPQFAALTQMQNNQRQMDMATLMQNFSGPSGRGTPGAFAQASYMAQANPANVLAQGQLLNSFRDQSRADTQAQGQYDLSRMGIDQNVLGMLMGAFQQAQGIGTPQAQNAIRPSGFNQVLGGIAGLAPYALAPFTGGASLGIPGMFGQGNPLAGLFGGNKPDGAMNPSWQPQWTPQPRR